jgi:hypothetical protein
MEKPQTETEEALEDTFGVEASLPYALRADQLADGAYRYALENVETGEALAEGVHADDGEALAEGVHADDGEALARFRQSLDGSGLSPDEIAVLRRATRQYERSPGPERG